MRDPLPVMTALFALAIVAITYLADRFALAIYALSFWHYLVYALAFFWRGISLERFKRDSVILKSIALATLAAVLWTTVPNLLSAIAMIAGFALNIAAAQALGADRTYYGYELEALPAKRITSFPYSMTAHPMLIGNMLAFGGTLLDGAFREAWWPLGILHVLLNLAIILIEARCGESRRYGIVFAISGLAIGALLLLVVVSDVLPYAFAAVTMCLLFGTFIIHRYASG